MPHEFSAGRPALVAAQASAQLCGGAAAGKARQAQPRAGGAAGGWMEVD
jgi:hypothetical protein